jgi:hypothetical protein
MEELQQQQGYTEGDRALADLAELGGARTLPLCWRTRPVFARPSWFLSLHENVMRVDK